MLNNSQLTNILREKGYKVTPQRLAIYEALASRPWHPSAEMLYKELKPNFAAMSLATVYKNMELLTDLELVKVLSTGEDSFRYDADMRDHHHVQCSCCGEIHDIFLADTGASLDSEVTAETGYQIKGREFYFFGLCPKCAAAKKH